jgi:putative oxidoreductase
MKFLSPFAEPAAALLRIGAGAMFMCHGVQKIFGLLGGNVKPVGSQLWFGGVIELIGGWLIALGLFTVPAALLASGTMAVAYIQFHWKVHLDQRFFPIVNKGELAAVYALLFLSIGCSGGGRYSLDHVLFSSGSYRKSRT